MICSSLGLFLRSITPLSYGMCKGINLQSCSIPNNALSFQKSDAVVYIHVHVHAYTTLLSPCTHITHHTLSTPTITHTHTHTHTTTTPHTHTTHYHHTPHTHRLCVHLMPRLSTEIHSTLSPSSSQRAFLRRTTSLDSSLKCATWSPGWWVHVYIGCATWSPSWLAECVYFMSIYGFGIVDIFIARVCKILLRWLCNFRHVLYFLSLWSQLVSDIVYCDYVALGSIQ